MCRTLKQTFFFSTISFLFIRLTMESPPHTHTHGMWAGRAGWMEFQADDACRQLQQLPHSGAVWPGDPHAVLAKCETEVKQKRDLFLKFPLYPERINLADVLNSVNAYICHVY